MKETHYLNNGEFLIALIDYRTLTKKAKSQKEDMPPVGDYIGGCFLQIAENLARRPNFASYTFRDDMIADAVENCLRSVHNFNPTKSTNPFAYFTQIIYFAFLRRISSEKKQLYTKYKATEQLGLLQDVNQGDIEEIGQERHNFKVYENINEFIRTFETSKQQRAKKAKKPSKTMAMGILRFVGDK